VFAAGLVLLKTIVWMIVLPLRIAFSVLLLPLLLLKTLVGGLVLLVIGPIVLVAILAGVLSVGAVLLAPLLPLALLAVVIWLIVRATSKTPAVTRP
jgi:hypothetical protein